MQCNDPCFGVFTIGKNFEDIKLRIYLRTLVKYLIVVADVGAILRKVYFICTTPQAIMLSKTYKRTIVLYEKCKFTMALVSSV